MTTMLSAVKRLVMVMVTVSILVGLALAVSTPTQRTVAYAKFQFAWAQNWPLSRGAYLPIRLAPTLAKWGIAGPALVEVAPGIKMDLAQGMSSSDAFSLKAFGVLKYGTGFHRTSQPGAP